MTCPDGALVHPFRRLAARPAAAAMTMAARATLVGSGTAVKLSTTSCPLWPSVK